MRAFCKRRRELVVPMGFCFVSLNLFIFFLKFTQGFKLNLLTSVGSVNDIHLLFLFGGRFGAFLFGIRSNGQNGGFLIISHLKIEKNLVK